MRVHSGARECEKVNEYAWYTGVYLQGVACRDDNRDAKHHYRQRPPLPLRAAPSLLISDADFALNPMQISHQNDLQNLKRRH